MATARQRFIIEHPTRGVLKDLEETPSGSRTGRFTIEGNRLSGMLFGSIEAAREAKTKIRPYRIADMCDIRREPTDEEIRRPLSYGDAWKVVA